MPKISVLMPVYNCAAYLSEAIESVLSQSFKDFELIIIDDGSTDGTKNIIANYSDSRIIVIENRENKGISYSLNKGISISSASLIARMDADDVCMPDRLQLQYEYLKANPDVFICGTKTKIIDSNGKTLSIRNNKIGNDPIKIALLFGETSISHPSVMMNKAFMERYDLRYDPTYDLAEDYELWCRYSMVSRMENLTEPLLCYREHNKSISHSKFSEQRLMARKILKKHLDNLHIPCTSGELECCFQLSLYLDEALTPKLYNGVKAWCQKIEYLNEKNGWFDAAILNKEIGRRLGNMRNRIDGIRMVLT